MSRLGGKGSSDFGVKWPSARFFLSYVVLLGNNNINDYHPLSSLFFLHQIISISSNSPVSSIEIHNI